MNRARDECIGGFQRPRSLEKAKRLWKTWKGLEPIMKVPDRYCQLPTGSDLIKEMPYNCMYTYDTWITKPATTQLPPRDPLAGNIRAKRMP